MNDDLRKLIEQSSQSDDVDTVALADKAVAADPEGDIFSWLRSMWDMTKGNGNPNIKELDERDLWVAGGGDPNATLGAYNMPWQKGQSTVTAADMGKFTAGRYVTDDDTQMRGILEDAIGPENVSYQQDKNGNTVVMIKGAPEPYYLNKPGLSLADVERVAGQLASFAPASKLATWGTKLGRAIKTTFGMGATQLGRELTAETMGGGDPDGNRILMTAALGALSVPVGDAIGFTGKRTWEGLQKWFGKDGALSKSAMKELQDAGVYSDDLTRELRTLYRDLESKYGQTVAVSKIADELTEPELRTPLTRGDLTQDIKAQQFESRADAGNYGNTAYMVSQGARAAQKEAIQESPDTLKASTGSGQFRNRNDAGAIIQDRLKTMRTDDEAAFQLAFDVAETTTTALPNSARQELLDAIAIDISKTGMHSRLEFIQQATDALSKILSKNNPSVTELNYWRRDWNRAAQKQSDGEVKMWSSKMMSAFDSTFDDLIERGLLLGDPQGAQWWKMAVKLRAAYGKNWEGKKTSHPSYIASKITDDTQGVLTVTPDEAANFILNSTNTQFYTQPKLVQGLRIVKNRLGPDSQEWLSIVDEVTLRMLYNASKSGTFKPGIFMKEWMQFKETNTGLVNLLYTLDEQKMISRWIYNAAKVGKKQPGGYNPSSTALFAGLPLVKYMRRTIAGAQAARAYSGQLPTMPSSPQAARMAALASQQAAGPIAEAYPEAGYAPAVPAEAGYNLLKNSVTGLLNPSGT